MQTITPATTPAIVARGLTRLFPGGHGVQDLDLHVPAGAVYGFLGPNGAGKTTTIRLLLGLLRPQAGDVGLFGHSVAADRGAALSQVGALVESPSLYGHLSGRDNLEVTRRLLGLAPARIDAVLERVGLLDAGHRKVREYSLGMRQRLAIALSLLGSPRLLVLDEPGNGLDPAGILDMRQLLRGLAAEGMTVFVSSHQLGEIEQVATHVGVLRAGRLCFEGRLVELRGRVRPRLLLRCGDNLRARALLASHGDSVAWRDPETLVLGLEGKTPAQVNHFLVTHGIEVQHLALERASLESLFFDLTVDQAMGEAA